MWSAEGKDQERLVPYAGGPVKTERKSRAVPIILIAVGVIIVIVAGLYVLGYFSYTPEPTGTQTWQQWGMSMQYPAGLKAQLDGIWEQQATNESGTVSWIWHQGTTELGLSWLTIGNITLDYEGAFQGAYEEMLDLYSNVTQVAQGNTTMGGATWQYRTWSGVDQGKTDYVTLALSHYTASQRFYMLLFRDSNQNTLASLMQYGNTFTG